MISVYNTLGRRLQPLETREPGKVGMYVCGPTVQSEPHLGHGRFAVVFDVIRRYLIWRGLEVMYVRNITDVEDKIIAAAKAAGETMAERAEKMTARFHQLFDALGVAAPDIEPLATETIPEMVELIESLIRAGFAYPAANGDVYFSVRRLEAAYGKLSGRNVNDLRSGARIEVNEDKVDPLDFALWKAAKPGEPAWDSPWAPGRPGWHIECSAMAAKFLGHDFDIHGGGADLIFPHHENEIAQSEAASGRTFARYWLHNGMVNLGGEKMSKSTGHVIDLEEAIERFGGTVVRMFYLRAHYRSPLEFSEELIGEASSGQDRIERLLGRVSIAAVVPDSQVLEAFRSVMDEDFGTPQALAVLFDAIRDANRLLDADEDAAPLVAAVSEIVDVLGIRPMEGKASDTAGDAEVEAMLTRRAEARAAKDFATSDRIREELAAVGVTIEDGPDGARWYRN